jgi:hypothetical protein
MALPLPFGPELKVLVLAGANQVPAGDLDEASHRVGVETPLEAKSFLHLRGRLVIEYVLEWIAGAGLRRVWVLAPPQCLAAIPATHDFVPLAQRQGASLAQNLRAAKEAIPLQPGEPALVVFGDHPLTTVRALEDFLAFCGPRLEQADLFHGLALREAYAAYAPYFRRTSMLMREFQGRATGLNLMVPDRIHGIPAADHVYSVRKLERFGRFVSLVGRALFLLGASAPGAILDSARLYAAKECEKLARRSGRRRIIGERGMRWLQRQVSITRVERYAAKLFGTERGVRVVPLAHGGTAIDVDFAEELAVLDENWEALTAIARRQDDASRAQSEGTTSSSL